MSFLKRKALLITLIISIFLLFAVTRTFGLLETVGGASADLDVADWIIKVDGNTINENQIVYLNNLSFNGNDNVEEGYFAPGTVGTYSLVLDTTRANVSLDYTFTVSSDIFTDHDNITFTLTSNDLNMTYSNGVYTGTILLSDPQIYHIDLNLLWHEDGNHDALDSELINLDVPINIDVNLIQHIS